MKADEFFSPMDFNKLRRPITTRESFLIIITVTALVTPIIFQTAPRSLPLIERINSSIKAISQTTCYTSDDIATIIISCGNEETDAVEEMRPLLTSIILLTSIPLRFIFITDDDGDRRIRSMFASLGHTERKMIVQILNLSQQWIEDWAAETNIDIYAHHSGSYGMAKLAAPWLLPNVSMGIVLDTDMVMLTDPALLWNEALREEGPTFQSGWVYRMILSKEMEKASQMCSCVIAMRLQKARKKKVYPDLVRKVLAENPKWRRGGSYKTPHGDQGVFYGLWFLDNRLIGNLNAVWNRDHCHNFGRVFENGNEKAAGILHRNCYGESHPKRNETNDGSPPFFDFYSAYRWHWLRAPDGHGCGVEIESVSHPV